MDDQQTREFGTDRDAIKRGSTNSSDTTKGRGSAEHGRDQNAGQNNASQNTDQGQGGSTMEQAKTMVRNVGEQAMSAASSAGTAAQDLARRAREQTGGMIDPLYQQGARAGEYLTRNVNEYPLAALLVAGAVGYGLAYLVHSNWQGTEWLSGNWTGGEGTKGGRNARRDRHD